MKTEEITIRVEAEAAKRYRAASESERRKLDLLLSLKLTDITRAGQSLSSVMAEISQKAQARGLTPSTLQSLLDDT